MSLTVTAQPYPAQARILSESGRETLDLAIAQKRALRASLAHKSEAVASEIGLTPRLLRRAAQEDDAAELPFRRVPALLRATPDPMPLLDFWAGLCACVVFRLPAGVDAKPMADAMRQFADLVDAHAEGIEDGVWDAHEVERLRKETHELIAAALANLAHVEARARRTA